ncbi:AI-2E family transporter [Candidatus Wolfebacteria bacterium]|nr:AI-2E family transporter [Candidatus Wolfebacteria bacterium]NCP58221.1 AI-2E family transporter [Candidatus Wolfebacteria bacterium]
MSNEISWTTLWRIFLMLLFVLALFWARQALIILFLAIVISSSIDGLVSWLQRKKIPRIFGTLLIFLVALTILALLLYTLIPIAIFELQSLLGNLKKIEIPIFGALDISQFVGIDKYLGNLGNLADVLFSGGASFLNIVAAVFGNLALIIATLILSFYLTVNRAGVEKFLRIILPIIYEDYIVGIYLRARKKMGRWLQGQILLMLVVGAATTIGLWILGVKYSLILGILAGVLEIVPIVGPIFSGTIAFLVAISESWILGLYVIILFLVIQQAESHLLIPLIMRKTVGISPVVVVIALLAGSQIAGLVGIILAVPTAVVLQEVIEDWERKKLKTQRLEMS